MKKVIYLGFAVLLLLSTLVLSGCGGGSTASDSDLITQTVNSFAQALVAEDVSRAASLSTAPVEWWTYEFENDDYLTYEISGLVISVNGSSATAAFNISSERRYVGSPLTFTGPWTLKLVKTGGRWLIDIFATIGSQGAF